MKAHTRILMSAVPLEEIAALIPTANQYAVKRKVVAAQDNQAAAVQTIFRVVFVKRVVRMKVNAITRQNH